MSPDELSTKADIHSLEEKIDALTKQVTILTATAKQETYLTSKEVCERYSISKSHLSDLRTEGKIPYTCAFGDPLHPLSGIEKVLKEAMKNDIANNEHK